MSFLVYFDERWIGDHGIGRVARNLYKSLDFKGMAMNGSPVSPFDVIRLTLAMARLPKNALVFTPGYNAPLFNVRPFVFIIHDLNHIDYGGVNILKRIYYSIIVKRACRYSLKVLTVSDFSKRRIVEWSGVREDKVFNIGNGVDDLYCESEIKYFPGYPYLLCVGNRKPHKNEKMVIKSFARSGLPSQIKILFTGERNEDLECVADGCGVANRILFLGHVKEEYMPSLYRGATALLFPSLYEGFGLPVIEAQACGVPVITSNTTSLLEVSGDAALLVDPESEDEISSAIYRIVNDYSLRQDLIRRGRDNASKYSWAKVVRNVEEILKECGN